MRSDQAIARLHRRAPQHGEQSLRRICGPFPIAANERGPHNTTAEIARTVIRAYALTS